jgi:hypothetical protein
VIILVAHFNFPPLGWKNSVAVAAAILGNPIGSFWSLLTRHEVIRRSYQRAVAANLSTETAMDITIICSTCDEFGWYNPTNEILKRLRNVNGDLIATATSVGATGNNDGEETEETEDSKHVLDPVEEYLIASAAHSLVSHRNDLHLGTWFSILGLLGGLCAAILKIWHNYTKPWSSRPLPMVISALFFIPMVQISSNIGAFTSVFGPLHVIQVLQKELQARIATMSGVEDQQPVFRLSLDESDIEKNVFSGRTSQDQEMQTTMDESFRFSKSFLLTAPYLGMNATWRPDKYKVLEGTNVGKERSSRRLLLYSVGFVSTSCLTAIIHSYITANHPGFGCRCLIGTIVYSLWLASPSIDYLLQRRISSCKKLWQLTVIKDSIFSAIIICIVTVVHIGMTGTCFCHKGSIFRRDSKADINLWPNTGYLGGLWWLQLCFGPMLGLSLTFLLLFTAQYDGHTMRTIMCPSLDSRHKMQLRLQDLRERLQSDR